MSYRQQVAELQLEVYREDYYTELWLGALYKHNATPDQMNALQLDEQTLVAILNDFWYDLPDSSEIHREPFFRLCDLCEGAEQ